MLRCVRTNTLWALLVVPSKNNGDSAACLSPALHMSWSGRQFLLASQKWFGRRIIIRFHDGLLSFLYATHHCRELRIL